MAALAEAYPGSVHVDTIGLVETPDEEIWDYAHEHGLAIVTKDQDFVRLSVVLGAPPKVIWVRLGNCSTDDVVRMLVEWRDLIEEFVGNDSGGFLALS